MTGDWNCSCSTTAPDDSCSCDRSIVHVLDLATPPRFEVVVRQPSSKRSRCSYKSMTAAGKTDAVVNAAVRKQFADSTEAVHRPSPVECNGRAPSRKQCRSHSEVVEAADRNSCSSATDGPQAPNPRVLDFCIAELQVTDQLQESGFCSAITAPYVSDDFDTVDLTVDDYRQRSIDADSWEERETRGTGAQIGDVRIEKGSSWARFKKYIRCRLCCQQR